MLKVVLLSQVLKCPLSYSLRIEEAPFDLFQRYELVNRVEFKNGKLVLCYDYKISILNSWKIKDLKEFSQKNKIPNTAVVHFKIGDGECYAANILVKNSEIVKYVNMIASGDHVKVIKRNRV